MHQINIQCNNLFKGQHKCDFPKVAEILNEDEYLNILKYGPQILFVFVFMPFPEYDYICLVNMWHPNIFGYLLIEICDIQIYLDICSCPFYDICLQMLPPPLMATYYVKRP